MTKAEVIGFVMPIRAVQKRAWIIELRPERMSAEEHLQKAQALSVSTLPFLYDVARHLRSAHATREDQRRIMGTALRNRAYLQRRLAGSAAVKGDFDKFKQYSHDADRLERELRRVSPQIYRQRNFELSN